VLKGDSHLVDRSVSEIFRKTALSLLEGNGGRFVTYVACRGPIIRKYNFSSRQHYYVFYYDKVYELRAHEYELDQ